MTSTGSIIREARRAAGLTQAQLAKRSGVSRETIARIETGQQPRRETAERLSEILKLDLAQIKIYRPIPLKK